MYTKINVQASQGGGREMRWAHCLKQTAGSMCTLFMPLQEDERRTDGKSGGPCVGCPSRDGAGLPTSTPLHRWRWGAVYYRFPVSHWKRNVTVRCFMVPLCWWGDQTPKHVLFVPCIVKNLTRTNDISLQTSVNSWTSQLLPWNKQLQRSHVLESNM